MDDFWRCSPTPPPPLPPSLPPPTNRQFTSEQLAPERERRALAHVWWRGERCGRAADDEGMEHVDEWWGSGEGVLRGGQAAGLGREGTRTQEVLPPWSREALERNTGEGRAGIWGASGGLSHTWTHIHALCTVHLAILHFTYRPHWHCHFLSSQSLP